jgi:cytoskeletal protein RodZ
VSIGDTLAEGRHQAGLTVTQVSQRTCIRETIVRDIERDDFSGCGGDFYARGHIRSIAGVVGIDPEPLVAEYDSTLGAPRAISAADVFQPVTPVRLKERRRPNWTAALAAAIVVVAGIFAYQHFAARSTTTAARAAAKVQDSRSNGGAKPKASTSPAATRRTGRLHIKLSATQDCWVQLTNRSGATLFSGMVYAGNSMSWNERHPVTVQLGNPSGVKLLVNGKNQVPRGSVASVTLTLHA